MIEVRQVLKERLKMIIRRNNVLKISDELFTLKSGEQSHIYVNWRNVFGSVTGTVSVASIIVDYIANLEDWLKDRIHVIYGVPDGMTKVAIISQLFSNRSCGSFYDSPLVMGRRNPKEYGDSVDRYFLGKPEGNVLLLEDVVTTGSSLTAEVEKLRETKRVANIFTLALTDRSPFSYRHSYTFPYRYVFCISELIRELFLFTDEIDNYKKETIDAVRKELREKGLYDL